MQLKFFLVMMEKAKNYGGTSIAVASRSIRDQELRVILHGNPKFFYSWSNYRISEKFSFLVIKDNEEKR